MKEKKIAVIDSDFLFFVSLTGEKILDINGQPVKVDNKFTYRERTFEESCNIADNYITNILNVTNATHYIGFFSGSSKSRKDINPDYKANRKDLEPLKNLVEMKHYLYDKWKFIWLTSYISEQTEEDCIQETDDFVVSYVKQNPDCFIVSPDKDLLMLEGNHYNPKKNEWVFVDKSKEELNFWISMICGDTADNIKGLPGKGQSYCNYLYQDISHLDSKSLGTTCFEAYVQFYNWNYDLAINKFYKNYKCLKLVDNLDVSMFTPIEWNNPILTETNYEDLP